MFWNDFAEKADSAVQDSMGTPLLAESLLSPAGLTHFLNSETPQAQRQAIVDDFNRTSQNTRMVFLLSTKAGGTGLNIVGASRLVLFDSDWNPSTDLQAMARIHREGQKRPCFIYRFLTTGTMDEKIYQRQITKTGLAGSLMDGDGGGASKKSKGKDAFSAVDVGLYSVGLRALPDAPGYSYAISSHSTAILDARPMIFSAANVRPTVLLPKSSIFRLFRPMLPTAKMTTKTSHQ